MLVGRAAEQLALDQLVSAARVGRSGVLVLTGEAGIGKTTLLDHVAGRAAGMRVLRAVGSAQERDVAFGGLLQLLRPVLDLLHQIPTPQAEALEAALAIREGRPGDRFAIGAATLSLLSRCAEDAPLLLLLDDAHELDPPSLEALVFASRRLLTDPVAVLAAVRSESVSPGPLEALPRLELSGISLEDADQLLDGRLDGPAAPELVRRLHRATAGNPLAILELAADIDTLEGMNPGVPLPVPEVLTGAFGRRVAQLDEAARSVLLLAALSDGDLAVMSDATVGLGGDLTALGAVEAAGLVSVGSGSVRFRHPLVRSSVYATAPPADRRAAHRAIADALPPADLERRTWHRAEATVGFDAPLAEDLLEVGHRARNRSAYGVAATAQERAAQVTPGRLGRARRLLTAAESAWLAGQLDRAGSLLDRSTALSDDAGLLAAADGLRGSIAAHSGSLAAARDMLTDAGRRLVEEDPRLAAALLVEAVICCLWMGDTAGALAARSFLERLDRSRLDQHGVLLAALGTGIAQVLAGEPGIDRIRDAVEALEHVEPGVVDPRRPASILIGVLFLRESEAGRHALHRLVGELRARAALGTLPSLLLQIARDEATTEEWQRGVTHYEEAIALARETGHTTDLTMGLAGLSSLHARMGREPECRRDTEEALALADRHQIHLAHVWATFALGDLELGLGRPEQAAGHYASLTGVLTRLGLGDVDISPAPEHAEALVRLGRTAEADRLARAYQVGAEAKGQPWARARAERTLALLSEGEDAQAHFEAALELHGQSPDRYEEARTQLGYGSALRRGRRRIAARPLLRAAVAGFERIGALPWAELARHELVASGETPNRAGDSPTSRLTGQELQISRMLAAGRTTRETAAALFLSPKTVEYHLRHVYTKLDIHSRAELATVLGDGTAED